MLTKVAKMYATRFSPALIVTVSVQVVQILCSNHFSILARDDNIACAPWHYVRLSSNNGMCKCASETSLRLIKCTDEGTLLRIGYCTTYTKSEGVSMAECPYLKMKRHTYIHNSSQ